MEIKWVADYFTGKSHAFKHTEYFDPYFGHKDPESAISAYTVAEGFNVLPNRFDLSASSDKYQLERGRFICSSRRTSESPVVFDNNISDAVWRQVIYLLENNLISVEEINNKP